MEAGRSQDFHELLSAWKTVYTAGFYCCHPTQEATVQKYFHQADVSMRRHRWIEAEEAEKVKQCGQDCFCCVRSEASHLLIQCCQQMSNWLILLRQT